MQFTLLKTGITAHVCLGKTKTLVRSCHDYDTMGCDEKTRGDETTISCYCNTDLCNGAVMTSSFGHVVMVVAMLVTVIIGYLL